MAAASLASAGHRALARGDVPATMNLLERAVAIEPDVARRVALVPELSEVMGEAGRFSDAVRAPGGSARRRPGGRATPWPRPTCASPWSRPGS